MEHCERGALHSVLADSKIIYSISTVITWAQQLFDAIDYLFREHKVVHRDIKPGNVFVKENFQLKLGDFGSVKECEVSQTATNVGTERYMSPPQIGQVAVEGEPKIQDSHKNDIYSLGLVLWELIERRLVLSEYGRSGRFDRTKFEIDVLLKVLPSLEPPNCLSEMQEMVLSCTAFTRKQRPTAGEVLEKLQNLFEKRDGQRGINWKDFHEKPQIEEQNTKLLKPIGFDGSKRRILVDASESSSILPVDHSMDVSSSENLPRAEPSLEESIKFCFNKSHLDARNSIAKKLIKRFQESSSEEKLEFCQNVPKILNSKSEEIEIIYDWTRTSVANNALVESQELNKIFEALIADDFRNQAKELISAYLFSINYEKLDYSLWKSYSLI